jgi:hypothetical protein
MEAHLSINVVWNITIFIISNNISIYLQRLEKSTFNVPVQRLNDV